ncbi:MAG: hypothetical protein MZV65_18645 [Chromatiales bacterium]|nr:hypothetical protein [Chromatiales bacterium]
MPAEPALTSPPVLYGNLGSVTLKAGTASARAQAWFDQGVRLAFAFNHAEAQPRLPGGAEAGPAAARCAAGARRWSSGPTSTRR